MNIKNCIIVFSLLWVSVSHAYPWMFFRERNDSDIIRLDSHASYFFDKEVSFFSGLDLNYHNPMLDLDLGYIYSHLENNHYFRLSELSVNFPLPWNKWIMSIGFQNILWSELDRYWNYGLWQARFLLDPLRTEQMGMPGVSFRYKTIKSSFIFLFSYLQLPDFQIYPEFIDNRVSSRNPLFKSTQGVNVNKLSSELFKLEKFLKPGLAFQLKHSIDSLHLNFSYAYKGMNQLKKAFLFKGFSPLKSSSISLEEFNYFSLYHELSSLEAELEFSPTFSLFAGVFYEEPKDKKIPKDWWSSDFSSHLTFSVLAYFKEHWDNSQNTLFTLGGTHIQEEKTSFNSNVLTDDYKKLFSREFDWKSAISASVEHENKNFYKGILFRFRTIYALDNQVYHFMFENYLYFDDYIRFYLSGDFVRRFSQRVVLVESSSIKRYNGLSRILLGVQCVF